MQFVKYIQYYNFIEIAQYNIYNHIFFYPYNNLLYLLSGEYTDPRIQCYSLA